jgi:hypothetical protein
MRYFLLENAWIVTIVWGLVYLADYYLTIYGARLFRTALEERVKFGGSYELTPVFRKDVDALKLFSPNFLWRWVLSMALFPAVFYLSFYVLETGLPYNVLAGGLFLRSTPILIRHARNIALARMARQPGNMEGWVQYSQKLNLRLSAVELWGFAAFYLVIAVVLPSGFFAGGALVTALTAWQHWALARKAAAQPSAVEKPQPSEG